MDKVDSGQRGYRIERALRATAEYLRCARAAFADVRFFRAVIDAHSRAREYAAATPRRSTLHAPFAAQIGNVFLLPKKHRRPHLDINAERSLMVFGATRDQPRDDRDCSEPIITIYNIQIKSLFTHTIYIPHRNSSHNTRFLSCISSHLWSSVEIHSATASDSADSTLRSPTKSVI